MALTLDKRIERKYQVYLKKERKQALRQNEVIGYNLGKQQNCITRKNQIKVRFGNAKPSYCSIQTPLDFIEALKSISSNESNLDNYKGVCGIRRERLRVIQSRRDKGLHLNLDLIKKANWEQLEDLMNRSSL